MTASRPTSGWTGLMVRGLGPEAEMGPIDRRDYPDLRRPLFGPVATAFGVFAWFIVVVPRFPAWLRISPVKAAGDAVGLWGSNAALWLSVLLIPGLFVVLAVLTRSRFTAVVFDAAVSEERWFRSGCQTWTPAQRLRSCVGFGFAHLTNLIVSLTGLGVLAVVGWVFQRAYLREFARSGDQRRATAYAAHFHARYNLTILSTVAAVTLLLVVAFIVDL